MRELHGVRRPRRANQSAGATLKSEIARAQPSSLKSCERIPRRKNRRDGKEGRGRRGPPVHSCCSLDASQRGRRPTPAPPLPGGVGGQQRRSSQAKSHKDPSQPRRCWSRRRAPGPGAEFVQKNAAALRSDPPRWQARRALKSTSRSTATKTCTAKTRHNRERGLVQSVHHVVQQLVHARFARSLLHAKEVLLQKISTYAK
ncbi:hypothetical protein HPB51_006926 [Rhipicephalus microplus]|uniref:Uncharacterized protein n=1 Tax=Rhipicephalus microplus TaxID=6941 RepID=A0A9J6DTK5_RHIMP|nr:hypothetical protein HPB51_006926 [Rhipicephalus microplus]